MTKIKFTKSSGNVYQDLGFSDADERLAKAELVMHINRVFEQRKLTQVQAAGLLGTTQSKISALKHGQLRGFSMEKLFHFLNLLNRDIEIIVRTKPGRTTSGSTYINTM